MATTPTTVLITGAAGFIGGHVAHYLSTRNDLRLILSDDFSRSDKKPNWSNLPGVRLIEREELIDTLQTESIRPDWVIHLGARTDTTEFDYAVHERLNLNYSKSLWQFCSRLTVPLIYASSAATYGDGTHGYDDDESVLSTLQPLNPYGLSKHQFDLWVMNEANRPPHWYGLKFFNVYGFRESHKGRMASMVYHGFHQVMDQGSVRLFRSHRTDYRDGEQQRDFIYVKDIMQVIDWLMSNKPASGIYNLGTGKARSFNDLIGAVFQAVGKDVQIEYIDMPQDLRDSYQYFTEAPMEKLRSIGYTHPFYTLEEGVSDYVQNYLLAEAEGV